MARRTEWTCDGCGAKGYRHDVTAVDMTAKEKAACPYGFVKKFLCHKCLLAAPPPGETRGGRGGE